MKRGVLPAAKLTLAEVTGAVVTDIEPSELQPQETTFAIATSAYVSELKLNLQSIKIPRSKLNNNILI